MRFNLVDRIVEVQPGRSLRAVKNLTRGEEYLADHFPEFPVMPGVLMLQALTEAGAWLLRLTDDYRHSVIVLREARNVKYGNFVEPGRQLLITVELVEQNEHAAVLKGKGEVEGNTAVSAKLTLGRCNLADRHPDLRATDEEIVRHLRRQCVLLRGGLNPAALSG
ncbi:MAG TPA: 3-hydroxyacyl-ACP dehydratase FabZ family protein [Gemmataceae bacterium]|nr:3-hydroxyacyl-ACP dehydratase FabZ family protein [Gemmataceae bacterium]